jgi:hypothetical protein
VKEIFVSEFKSISFVICHLFEIVVFLDVAPFSLVNKYQCFRGVFLPYTCQHVGLCGSIVG